MSFHWKRSEKPTREDLMDLIRFVAAYHCGLPQEIGVNVETVPGQFGIIAAKLMQYSGKSSGGHLFRSQIIAWDVGEFLGKTLKEQFNLVLVRVTAGRLELEKRHAEA